jgi:hypothetical protein
VLCEKFGAASPPKNKTLRREDEMPSCVKRKKISEVKMFSHTSSASSSVGKDRAQASTVHLFLTT